MSALADIFDWRPWRGRVPFVSQLEDADCGAACLAMVLAYHGKRVDLGVLQDAMSIDRDGASASSILEAGTSFGLRGRGIAIDVEDFQHLPPASVLHWGFNHFVVFERAVRDGIHIVDPAMGRRFMSWARVRRSFTGVALCFERGADVSLPQRRASRFWAMVRRLVAEPQLLARIAVTSVLLRLFALSVPILMGFVVDRVVPRSDRDMLYAVAGGLAVMMLFQGLSGLLRGHLLLALRARIDLSLSPAFLEHLMSLPYAFFLRRSSGDLLMRVNSHATIRDLLTTSTISALIDGVFVLTYLVLIAVLSPWIALLVAGLGVLQLLAFWLSAGNYRDLNAQELETRAATESVLVQIISGVETLKAQGAERWAIERWSHAFADEVNVALARGRLSVLIDTALLVFQTLAPLSILVVGAVLVMDGAFSLGTMLALSALAGSFLGPLRALFDSAMQLQLLGGYVDRIDDVLGTEPERGPGRGRPAPKLRGAIRLTGVTFGYGNAKPVLEDVDLDIPAGSTVAIVGSSGSGKSTLAKLLLGLYEPTRGTVSYDGHDVAGLDLVSLRRQLGVVMQSPHLFGGSVRTNIAVGTPGGGFAEVVHAARLACIDDVIESLPMGYETLTGDDGETFSGGERQRLALARALVSKPAVLLLDEATSALDTEVERQIMKNLEQLECTRVLIAHRMSTVASADLIVVLEDGKVVERGDHHTLLAQGGHYARLVRAQA